MALNIIISKIIIKTSKSIKILKVILDQKLYYIKYITKTWDKKVKAIGAELYNWQYGTILFTYLLACKLAAGVAIIPN